MKNMILYAKLQGMAKFAPLDLANNKVAANDMFATLIPESRLDELKTAIKAESKQTGTNYYIKEAGTNKILFKTN